MGSFGGKNLNMKLVTSSTKDSDCKDQAGNNIGAFVYTFFDDDGIVTPDPTKAVRSDITFVFLKSFNIPQISIQSDPSNISTGNFYACIAPGDVKHEYEFITQAPLNMIDVRPYVGIINPPLFIENVGEKVKMTFIFKGHTEGLKLTYYLCISGEEFDL